MDKTVKDILTDLNSNTKLENEKSVQEIKKKIFSLDVNVDSNETIIFKTQWTIEENRRMILNNYHAAFSVNTKLANENTRDIFHNRFTILSRYKIKTEVEGYYLEYHKRKSDIDYLNHKIEINKKVLEISSEMSKINKTLIELNRKIMDLNTFIVDFNKKQINNNQELINKNLINDEMEVFSEEQLLKKNEKDVEELEKKIKENEKEIYSTAELSSKNANEILRNRNQILERRELINNNKESIQMNKSKIFLHFK